MANQPPPISIIAATPGYKILYGENDGSLFVSGDVIAWRIEIDISTGVHFSSVTPITVAGDPTSDWVGLLQPDGSVTLSGDEFESLDAAIKERRERTAVA